MRLDINTEIAITYLISRKRQTTVAALGVTFGISMYIFMNSLISGTNEYFEKVTLSTTPHIRLFAENKMADSRIMNKYFGEKSINLIINPQPVNTDIRIENPNAIMSSLKKMPDVVAISAQVGSTVIYTNGTIEMNGTVSGVNILELDKMFDIQSTMIAGNVRQLEETANGIIIGSGIAADLNVNLGQYISVSTSAGVTRRLKVVGVFRTTIKNIDNTRSYANIKTVDQLLRKDRSYITDIYVNIKDHTKASRLSKEFEQTFGYKSEDWQTANEQSMAARMIRDVIANAVVITILVVAGFGIYNILNMTIYEKIKEIAILKATGFGGKHVIGIFIRQAVYIGIAGSVLGVSFGWLISFAASRFYIGMGNVMYLPITFYPSHYIQGFLFGVITTFMAGYIPAIKASEVDPVQIIRGS